MLNNQSAQDNNKKKTKKRLWIGFLLIIISLSVYLGRFWLVGLMENTEGDWKLVALLLFGLGLAMLLTDLFLSEPSFIVNAQGDFAKQFLENLKGKERPINWHPEWVLVLHQLSDKISNRMNEEIRRLRWRGYVGLIIGIVTTAIAVAILASAIAVTESKSIGPAASDSMAVAIGKSSSTGPNKSDSTASTVTNSTRPNMSNFITIYLPRIMLAIITEVFAFFFLRLYKSMHTEMKYFHNELTNIEAKFVSLYTALILNDRKTLGTIMLHLARTERNFVLKSGETTVASEADKHDQQVARNLFRWVSMIFANGGKKPSRIFRK